MAIQKKPHSPNAVQYVKDRDFASGMPDANSEEAQTLFLYP